MYKLSFKVRHKGCFETGLSLMYPKHHITVVDIQSTHQKEKQYFYYITGNSKDFDAIISFLKKSTAEASTGDKKGYEKGYKLVREIERSTDTLLLLVILYQQSYIQNVIQKYNGFFIDLHTISGGYEYWHVGVVDRANIPKMLKEFKKMGDLKVLYLGEVDFANILLSKQQKKVLLYAHEQGYYELPRKTNIAKIAKALKINSATAGEHLLKAENKLIKSMARKI